MDAFDEYYLEELEKENEELKNKLKTTEAKILAYREVLVNSASPKIVKSFEEHFNVQVKVQGLAM